MALRPWSCISIELLRSIVAEPGKDEWSFVSQWGNIVVAKPFRVNGVLIRIDFFLDDDED